MMFLLPLFRHDPEARRARWFVYGALAGSIVIAGAYERSTPALAADPDQCHKLGEQLGSIVLSATDDQDLQQAVSMSAEAHCILLDEAPVTLKVSPYSTAPDPGMAPNGDADVTLNTAVGVAKRQWCRSHFRTYREADGTVIRPGSTKRTACPWPNQ